MVRLISITAAAIFILVNTVYGDVKLFLKPNVSAAAEILLNDIASIETEQTKIASLKNIVVGSELYSDGYIDKKELSLLLKQHTDDNITIYGGAVKVFNGDQVIELSNIIEQDHTSGFLLRKGDPVDVVVKKNGISIILKGTAIDEGRINDEIAVRIDYRGSLSKAAKGKIKAKDLVEINI